MSDTAIQGVILSDLSTIADDRGGFTELFRASWFPRAPQMAQVNLSASRAGVLRGMHVHHRQADYWCVLKGRSFVGLCDLRAGSPTRLAKATLTLDAEEGLRGLRIPAGVAHGFCALTDILLLYLVDSEFAGDDEFGFAWDDPQLGIAWPVAEPILSKRDLSNPTLAAALSDAPAFAG